MSPHLRPETVQALHGFLKRRTRLIWLRGGFVALCFLLLLLVLAALADRLIFMPDSARETLGYIAYAGGFIAAWVLGWRLLVQARSERDAARLLETVDPAMRERLLSAVEISESKAAEESSEEFRSRLQDDVATHLSHFDALKALPLKMVRPWIVGFSLVIATIVGLCFIPDLHLPGFLARAALPFANFPRPSSLNIQIVTPQKGGDAIVALASSVPVAVQIKGKTPRHVYIETKSADSKPVRLELSAMGANRYEGSIPVGQSSVHYRVTASDAISAWHKLDARPRPRILEFVKKIVPPSYTGLPATELHEDQGDISALEGSEVKLTLKANQPLQQMVATILPTQAVLNTRQAQPTEVSLSVPVDGKSDSWQIALTAKETGFTNEESTPWRIESVQDLPPTITITEPKEQIESRIDDTVTVAGDAADDVGLAKIEMNWAVNGADWQSKEIAGKSGKETHVIAPLKLATLPLKAGDALLVKLTATDLKGQHAESAPVRILLVEDQLNPVKRAWAADQRRLAKQAQTLAEQARQLLKDTERRANLPKNNTNATPEAQAEIDRMREALQGVKERSEELWRAVKDAAKQAPDRLAAKEMDLAGAQLAALRADALKELDKQIHAPELDPHLARTAAYDANAKADTVANALRAFATEHTAQAAKEHLEQLAPQQNHLADKAIEANRDKDVRPKWQEQQRAALEQAEHGKEDLQDLADVIQDGRKHDVENQIQNIEKKANAMKAAMDSKDQHQAPEFVYSQSHEMRNADNQARDAARWFADEANQKAREMRERLADEQNPALAALQQAKDRANQASNAKQDRNNNREPMHEQTQQKLAAAARQFKDQSELREQNPQTNNAAALDQNRLGRALDNLAEQAKKDSSPDNMKRIAQQLEKLDKAARTLDADAHAQDAKAALQEGQQEAATQTDPTQQLATAQAAATELKPLPNLLRQAQAPNKAADNAQNAANNSNWQRDELQNQQRQMAQQKQNGQQPQLPPPDQNHALQANNNATKALDEALKDLAPQVADARNAVSEATPKLSQLAQNTANELRENQKQTQQAADNAKKDQNANQAAQEANALVPKAQDNAQRIADLQSALRQEADQADLNQDLQRQMARTADGALDQLRKQSPQITQDIQKAAQSQQAPEQAAKLNQAAQAQQQTADALDKLAQNLSKMEQGQGLTEQALADQKALEESLGIKQPLDDSYQKAQQLADLVNQAQQDPQAALNALEQELQHNPAMQRALGNLAQQTAQQSQQQVAQAQKQPPANATQAAEQAAYDDARVARHEQRLNQMQAAQDVAQASQQLQQIAQNGQQHPEQNTPQTAQQAAQAAQTARNAANDVALQQNNKIPPPQDPLQESQASMLAQALDQLDQATHPNGKGQQGQQQAQANQGQQQQQQGQQGQQGQQQGQQGQQGQKGQQASSQQQNAAQQSLNQASQAQSQSMAQARAQGMVPGQQQPAAGQMANNQQNQQGQPKGQPSQQPAQQNGMPQDGAPNLLVPALVGAQEGDWGHLPTRMAKDLTEASRQEPSPEYRAAIESYYKAIAEKAKQ